MVFEHYILFEKNRGFLISQLQMLNELTESPISEYEMKRTIELTLSSTKRDEFVYFCAIIAAKAHTDGAYDVSRRAGILFGNNGPDICMKLLGEKV